MGSAKTFASENQVAKQPSPRMGSLVCRGRPLPDLSCHLRGVRLKIGGEALLLQILCISSDCRGQLALLVRHVHTTPEKKV